MRCINFSLLPLYYAKSSAHIVPYLRMIDNVLMIIIIH